MPRSLVWLRNDLRVSDNEPLRAAASAGTAFVLVCIDPRHFEKTPFGFDRTGPHRTQFLLQSIADLRDRIRSLDGELIVRVGRPAEVIAELLPQLAIDRVHFHEEVGSFEEADEAEVIAVCRRQDVRVKTVWGHTLFSLSDLPFEVSQTPSLFTQFRKQVEKACRWQAPVDVPASLSCELPVDVSPGRIPSCTDLGITPPHPDVRGHREYHGGETAGRLRLREYIWDNDRLRIYKLTRNGMLNVDDSSKFSMWLANGCLSPRIIAAEVASYEEQRVANDSTYWMIFELLWRDYFRLIAKIHGRQLFRSGGLQGLNYPWDRNEERFRVWAEGRTGFPLVDANMRELVATGYMSNRGRQNVGSFLTKNLGLDWRMGAEWFESWLIDYDVASNYGNWNYVAGVGNDARGFRFFNITKQAHDYDPDGRYVKHWLTELAPIPDGRIHQPWLLSPQEQTDLGIVIGRDYPAPIVDLHESARQNEAKYNRIARRRAK